MNSPADLGGRVIYAGLIFERNACSAFRAMKEQALHIQYREQTKKSRNPVFPGHGYIPLTPMGPLSACSQQVNKNS